MSIVSVIVAAQPPVEDLAADPVVPAGQRNVSGDLTGVPDDRQPPRSVLIQFSICHKGLLLIRDPRCQRCSSVLEGVVLRVIRQQIRAHMSAS